MRSSKGPLMRSRRLRITGPLQRQGRVSPPPRGDADGTVCGAEPSNRTDGTFIRVDVRFTSAPSFKGRPRALSAVCSLAAPLTIASQATAPKTKKHRFMRSMSGAPQGGIRHGRAKSYTFLSNAVSEAAARPLRCKKNCPLGDLASMYSVK
jgi:hypothetical protein